MNPRLLRVFDNSLIIILLPVMTIECLAWHTAPHQQMTRAAVDSLPVAMQERLGPEKEMLIMVNCMYPDRYRSLGKPAAEKSRNPGPNNRAEMKIYCELPDGRTIHNVSQNRQEDLDSFKYLLNSIVSEIRRNNIVDAAKYMGTLAHLIEDSASPAHAGKLPLVVMELVKLQPIPDPPPWAGRVDADGGPLNLHAVIELTISPFTLDGRAPKRAGKTVSDAATELLDRSYAIAEENRAQLLQVVRAAYAEDTPLIERLRSPAARQASELLADAYFTALTLAAEKK